MIRAASRAFLGLGGRAVFAMILTFVPHATLLESTVWTTDFLALTTGKMDAGNSSLRILIFSTALLPLGLGAEHLISVPAYLFVFNMSE